MEQREHQIERQIAVRDHPRPGSLDQSRARGAGENHHAPDPGQQGVRVRTEPDRG